MTTPIESTQSTSSIDVLGRLGMRDESGRLRPEVRAFLEAQDSNKDGKISSSEFRRAVENMLSNVNIDRIPEIPGMVRGAQIGAVAGGFSNMHHDDVRQMADSVRELFAGEFTIDPLDGPDIQGIEDALHATGRRLFSELEQRTGREDQERDQVARAPFPNRQVPVTPGGPLLP